MTNEQIDRVALIIKTGTEVGLSDRAIAYSILEDDAVQSMKEPGGDKSRCVKCSQAWENHDNRKCNDSIREVYEKWKQYADVDNEFKTGTILVYELWNAIKKYCEKNKND